MADESLIDHEQLHVYQLARAYAREGRQLIQQIPPGHGDILSQFRQTLFSIPLNVAEGGGEFAPNEKARFYRIAKRSATESAAILDHMVDFGLLNEPQIRDGKTLLRRIIAGLVKLILSTARKPEPHDIQRTRGSGTSPTPAPARKRVRASET